jgi:Tripartite tricarboxylate transporter TctB family
MTERSTQRRRDLFLGLGVAASALLVAFTGGLIAPSSWLAPTQSPSLFPAACLLGVAVCGLIIAGGSVPSSNLGSVAKVTPRAVIMGGVMAIYAIVLPLIGLIASTVALLGVLPLLFAYRKWGTIALFAVIIIGVSWFIFIEIMGVPLKL